MLPLASKYPNRRGSWHRLSLQVSCSRRYDYALQRRIPAVEGPTAACHDIARRAHQVDVLRASAHRCQALLVTWTPPSLAMRITRPLPQTIFRCKATCIAFSARPVACAVVSWRCHVCKALTIATAARSVTCSRYAYIHDVLPHQGIILR
jgi:hypothetical protein